MPDAAAFFPPVTRTEIDGVPTVWAELPGPFTASLMFRVGRADESLATGGLTHLVEHLALPGEPHDDYDHNGMVEQARTVFFARGEPDQVANVLAEICARLADLPVDRLAKECGILLTEEATAGPNPVGHHALTRFGTTGYGLAGCDQMGLYRLTAEDIVAWSARHFTRENCAVVLSGAPPAGMRLDLSAGSRMPAPEPRPVARQGRLWFDGHPGIVTMSLLGPTRGGLSTGLRIAARRIHTSLRQERGMTYTATVIDEPLGPSAAHRVLLADCMDQNADAVRDGMLDAIEAIAGTAPADAELKSELSAFMREIRDPMAMLGFLDYLGERELHGEPPTTLADELDARAALTPEDVRRVVDAGLATAQLAQPEGVSAPPEPWQAIPAPDDEPIAGRLFRRSGVARVLSNEQLIVGEAGVSLRADGRWSTFAWADIELMVRHVPGPTVLVERTGGSLQLLVESWGRARELQDELERYVPSDRRVTITSP